MSHISEPNTNLLPQEKRALLAQLLREKASKIKSAYPLSHGQQALWFLYQIAPLSAAYNTNFSARIRSHVDVPALKRTFEELMLRHPTLRSTFSTHQGEPIQEVHGYQEVCFEQVDASKWNWDELTNKVTEEYQRPFNLEQGSVLRVHLFTRSCEDHILLLTIHHIAYDGWSLWILLDELRVLYPAMKSGNQASMMPLVRSYQDYVRWQTQMLAGLEGERLWCYWQKQLAGELPVLELPTDRPRPSVQTYRGASCNFKLTEELTSKLKKLAQVEGVTLYTLLLTAFKTLLYRYTGQKDILLGSPTAGRNQTEFAAIVGYFTNPIVLRSQISDNPTFKAFLATVQKTVLEAIAHQDYPFALLVEKLQPRRDPSRSPLLQASFVLQKPQQFAAIIDLLTSNDTETRLNWGDLVLEPFHIAQQEGQLDLILEMVEARESLVGVFKYSTVLFDATTITRMVGHFQTLLEGIVTNPQERISQLPLLTEVEQQQLLVQWNSTTVEYPHDQCIHQLFEEQAERTPDAVAVVYENQQLTYHQLNYRANQLAHYLQSLGVGADVLVGFCVERSVEMVVVLLSILKAGGAYVPLDPNYPPERLGYMLADSQVSVLLTQQKLIDLLPQHNARVVCLDADWSIINTYTRENLISSCKAINLAYVIYTSGSTGKPKGVLIPHQSLVNHSLAIIEQYKLTYNDRVLQFANLSFDVVAEELFPSLLSGATVVLRPTQIFPSFVDFAQFLEKQRLTVLNLPTPYWHEWVLELSKETMILPESIRLVIVGSEKVQPEKLAIWQKHIGHHVNWHNAYGVTEATITTTVYNPVITPKTEKANSVPIGRPIANTQIYILDRHLQPVPIGVPGELYIGGAGLARGYLNNPELTDEKFISNPFSHKEGERLYKTGDLARYLINGNIEFLDRIDYQVKIRGFRIELREIEAVLKKHPLINEAVLLKNKSANEHDFLSAHIILANNTITIQGATYRVVTTAQSPILMDRIEKEHSGSWPSFFAGDQVILQYWRQLYDKFPDYQFAVLDANENIVAVGNGIPLYWSGDASDLPLGWDDAIIRGSSMIHNKTQPNTLCALAVVVNKNVQARGLSYEIIKLMCMLVNAKGLDYLIVPVRPVMKEQYPYMNFEEYVNKKRDDGLAFDPWIRVHEKLGGKIIGYSDNSQLIQGIIPQWEQWTGRTFEESGRYIVKGALGLVNINIEGNIGIYYDPSVWFQHQPKKYADSSINFLNTSDIKNFMSGYVPDYMIPTKFNFINKIPVTSNGKIAQDKLISSLSNNTTAIQNFVPPSDIVEQQLVQIWEEVLETDGIGIRDNFFNLGGHSLLAIRLMGRIQQQFGKNLPLSILLQSPTIEQLANVLQKRSDSSLWSPLVAIQPNGSKRPFFCVPGAGGNVVYLYQLGCCLSPDQPFYALQAYGLDGESKPITKIEDIAARYIEAIQTVQPQGPYLLGGHSFGGVVAFEMANRLIFQGHRVALLTILDTPAPIHGTKPIGIDWNNARWLVEIAKIVERLFRKNLYVSYDNLQSLEPEEQLNYLLKQLIKVNFLPSGAGIIQLRALVEVFKANCQFNYIPGRLYQTPITLLRASEALSEEYNREIPHDALNDLALGWGQFSDRPVDVHFVPGNHFTMIADPHVQLLGKQLEICIKQVETQE